MIEMTRIGSVPGIGIPNWATYVAGSGVIIGGPSRTHLSVPDTARVGSGLIAGEALNPWDACFIFRNFVYQSLANNAARVITGVGTTTALERARCDGFADLQTQAGEAVTLWGSHIDAAYTTTAIAGVTPIDLYVSTTIAGGLCDTSSTITSIVQPPVARYLGDGRVRNRIG
jgi:hypothetical protein